MAHSDSLVRIHHSMCMTKCRILHYESQLNSFKPHKSKLHADKGCEILATVQSSLVTFLPTIKKCKDKMYRTVTWAVLHGHVYEVCDKHLSIYQQHRHMRTGCWGEHLYLGGRKERRMEKINFKTCTLLRTLWRWSNKWEWDGRGT
jgi:hypothetical protein